jgi:K+-sensing histidine kinase KdpD
VDSLDEVETYSKQPVTVAVRSEGLSRDVHIHVSDEGPGFSDLALQTLYQPGNSCWMSDQSRHKGMGLYVAKRMMQAVGGDISYAGLQGRGATMILSLRDWGVE